MEGWWLPGLPWKAGPCVPPAAVALNVVHEKYQAVFSPSVKHGLGKSTSLVIHTWYPPLHLCNNNMIVATDAKSAVLVEHVRSASN